MPAKKSPAVLAQNARDMVEQLNHLVLNEAATITAPNINDTVRPLMQLADRLEQAFEQLAAVLEMRAKEGAIGMDTDEDPDDAVAAVAEALRAAAGDVQGLAQSLAVPARTLSAMDHRR